MSENPAAFARPAYPGSDMPNTPYAHHEQDGMTLRDYFAAAALQGLCANPGAAYQANSVNGWGIVNCTVNSVANEAYELADAMLKARGESNEK